LLAGLIGLAAVAVVQSRANAALAGKNLLLTAAQAATARALTATQEEQQKTEAALAQSEAARRRAEVRSGMHPGAPPRAASAPRRSRATAQTPRRRRGRSDSRCR
jgi:hypothetical protein